MKYIFLSITLALTIACAEQAKFGSAATELIDERDGKKYKIVQINEQTWMAENLNYNAKGSKCYENDDANCKIYGRLYNWATAIDLEDCTNFIDLSDWTTSEKVVEMDDWATFLDPDNWVSDSGFSYKFVSCLDLVQNKHKGICPEGWHIPSNDDWDKLFRFADGKHLKAKQGWRINGNGLDSYGFAALPGGYGIPVDIFGGIEYEGYWWSSSEDGAVRSYSRLIDSYFEDADYRHGNNFFLYSVRCVKN